MVLRKLVEQERRASTGKHIRVCRMSDMASEYDAQQSAAPVSGEKAHAEPVCLITVE